jgi:hypothetical protein
MADFTRGPLDVEELQTELTVFERRYGTSSEDLARAFNHDGQLVETADFLRWTFVYSLLNVPARRLS